MSDSKNTAKTGGGRVETQARSVAEPILNEAGYRLWDVVFEKEGAMWYLRVLFDKTGSEGITDEECEKITAPINAAFDCQKFIENVDILEIGSPGLTRRLRLPEHFEKSMGLAVRCTVRGEKGKTETVSGKLEGYSDDGICIRTKNTNSKANENESEIVKIENGKCIRINLDL